MKSDAKFELQLVVIGILIPVYLTTIPPLIEPALRHLPMGLSLGIPKAISYILGFAWFVCLLFGTISLTDSKGDIHKKSQRAHKWLFRQVNYVTIILVGWVLSAYIGFSLSFYLTPILFRNPVISIIVILTILLFIVLWHLKIKELIGGLKK